MTTPLTPDEERKLAEAVFYDDLRIKSLLHNPSKIDYEGDSDYWRRLVEFICNNKGLSTRHKYFPDNVLEFSDAIETYDTESLKRMALELIP